MWVGVAVIALVFLGFRALVVAQRSGRFGASPTLLSLFLGVVGLAGVLVPFVEGHLLEGVALTLALLALAVLWKSEAAARLLAAIPRTLAGRALLILCWATVIPFGGAEWLARMATNFGLLEYYKPLQTVYVNVPMGRPHPSMLADPVLFWRPKDGLPYNDQGFKGPLVELPKPEGVFRIVTYGDSNTAGMGTTIWPAELQKILERERGAARDWEVLNAGVHGYSSYQGLERFRQEVERVEPDLILVSFGWNDLADARGQPDKAYASRSDIVTGTLGILLEYRVFLVSLHYLRGSPDPVVQRMGRRVSVRDYVDNLQGFEIEARRGGAVAVLLTRPHRAPTEQILRDATWRARVPSYNQALIEHAERSGTPAVDVQAFFEENASALFEDECHFSDAGQPVMAQFIYDELVSRQLIP
jgi:lysophospholipase L1-like esterase